MLRKITSVEHLKYTLDWLNMKFIGMAHTYNTKLILIY